MSAEFVPQPFNIVKLPFMPLYAREFMNPRVQRMSAAQRGIFIMLLCQSWIDEGLDPEPESLAMVSGVDDEEFTKEWKPPLSTAWEPGEDGKLRCAKQEFVRMESVEGRNKLIYAAWKRHHGGDKQSDAPASHKQRNSNADASHCNSNQLKSSQTLPNGSASASAPQAEQTRRSKRANREANMLEACERINAPAWLPEALGVYMRARMSAKFKVWSTELWEDEAEQVLKLGEEAGRKLCMRASKKPWSKIVFEDSFDANAQQASSQGPSRGGFYRGPALKDVEARTARRNIADRYRQMTGNILLEDEDAFEMARADDDWHMHDYDWKTGRRNDAPPDKPRSGTTIDFPPTPF